MDSISLLHIKFVKKVIFKGTVTLNGFIKLVVCYAKSVMINIVQTVGKYWIRV